MSDQTTDTCRIQCGYCTAWRSKPCGADCVWDPRVGLRADAAASERRELRATAALQAIRRITGDTHPDSPGRERPYTALSQIDQIARRALA